MNIFSFFKKKESAEHPLTKEDILATENFILQRDADFEKARNCDMSNYKIVRAIDLKVGDVFVHSCNRIKITECGCGWGAGNEFGYYFWVKGRFICDSSLFDKWLFQEAPIVLCVKEN